MNLAKTPGENQFTSDLIGPPSNSLDACGQFVALDFLNAGIGIAPALPLQTFVPSDIILSLYIALTLLGLSPGYPVTTPNARRAMSE